MMINFGARRAILVCAVILSSFIGGLYAYTGRRLCPQTRKVQEIVPMNQTYIRPFYNKDCISRNSCNGSRIYYKIAQRTVFYRRMVHDVVRTCCPGWKMKHPRDLGCMMPICKKPCKNGGTCIGPDQCSCPSQYTGMQCEKDVDECSTGKHTCQQICKNTIGGYKCACFDGYRLLDGEKCDFCPVCLPAFEEMMNKVNEMQLRINTVEKEKEEILGNFTVLENHYANAITQVEELRQVTFKTLSTTPPSIVADEAIYKLDRITSLSEQISLLEERIGSCSCGMDSSDSIRVGSRQNTGK